MSWVKVIGDVPGREVFVNGNHVDAAGRVGTPFEVDPGMDTFELLTPSKTVERSVSTVVSGHPTKQDPQVVDISPGSAGTTAVTSSGSPS